MPSYDTMVATEKACLILEIGVAYTKAGFARENGPRFIIPTEVRDPYTGEVSKLLNCQSKESIYSMLKEFLYSLFFEHLAINPKDRRVVIVESVYSPTLFRETLAELLFVFHDIASIVFVPSHLMALFTLGIGTALVIDVGYSETVVLPIYDGVPLLNSCESLNVGGLHIHGRLEAELMQNATVKIPTGEEKNLSEVLSERLEETCLEDIKVRTCFVTPRARGLILQAHEARKRIKGTVSPDPEQLENLVPPPDVPYLLKGDMILMVPGKLREWAAELLFEQDPDDFKSVPTLVLDSLLRCPIDTRKELAGNLIVVGGTSMLPGFKHSLLTEIKMLLDDQRYSTRLPLKEFKIHEPPAKENVVAWLGASIFASTEALNLRSLSKAQYMTTKTVPDWSDNRWAERV